MMDDFAVNADSLDGDFKALLAMRKNQKLKAEREEKLANIGVEKFKKYQGQISRVADKSEAQVELIVKDEIDIKKFLEKAFSALECNNISQLKEVFADLKQHGKDADQLVDPETNETLLHRILSKKTVDKTVLKEILSVITENYICKNKLINVGGKSTGQSVLHIASEKGHMEAVNLLVMSVRNLEKQIKLVDSTTIIKPEGQRPRPLSCLHIAAKCGHNDLVTYFIKSCGMSVNEANSKGDTPILWAANDNKPETVKLLISLEADVNAKNDKGSSALHWACRNGYTEVVKVLLSESKDINVNIERSLGLVCPLIAASAMGFIDIVQLLIEHGANLEQRMGGGQTAIHVAAAEGHLDIVVKLLESGANINAIDTKGNSALIHAASHGQHKVAIFLGQCGGDFSHKNLAGQSVWDFALEQKNTDLIKALVEFCLEQATKNDNTGKKTDSVPVKLPQSITLLHSAASIGDESIIQLLIDMNIDLSSEDSEGKNFLHVAIRDNQLSVVKKFANDKLCKTVDGRGYNLLHTACECTNNEAIGLLLPLSDLKMTTHYNQTALHLAVRSDKVSQEVLHTLVTQMILHYEWTVLHTTDEQKRTALHIAVMSGNHTAISHLHHLSADTRDINGNTPVHLAVLNADSKVLEKLIKVYSSMGKTIDLNIQNKDGDTALHLAAISCNPKIADILVRAGADLVVLNDKRGGLSMLHLLGHLMTQDKENSINYIKVLKAVENVVIYWWCRHIHKGMPDDQDLLTIKRYQKEALIFLFTQVSNSDGLSVLQFSAQLPAKDMVLAILNCSGVFVMEHSLSTITYDVTDLLPSFASWQKSNSKKLSSVAPRELPEDGKNADVPKMSQKTIAEFLDNADYSQEIAEILDVSPFKNIVKSYWTKYQILYAVTFFIHVAVLAVYSYFGITYLECPVNTSATNSTSSNAEYIRPWYADFGLSLSLTWSILLILYNAIWLVQVLVMGVRKSFKTFLYQVNATLGASVLQLCGFLYATFTIVWYAMNRTCVNYQEYILALSYLFGWVYSISFTRGFKNVHHFSVIMQHIFFKDMIRFFFIYLFILLAFSFTYAALVQPIDSLKITGGSSMFLAFNWMIGMADFEAEPESFAAVGRSEIFVEIVYASYVILSTIILLNLLIAMMNDSYADIKQRSEIMWKVSSLRLPLEFEKSYLGKYLKSMMRKPQNLYFENDRWFLPIPVDQVVPYKAQVAVTMDELKGRIDAVSENMDRLLTSLEEMKSKD